MKGFILKDDPRLTYTEKELVENGCTIFDQFHEDQDLDFIFLGFHGLDKNLSGNDSHYHYCFKESYFKDLPKNILVYTGKKNSVLNKLQEKYGFQLITLMQEESIINKNAILTAEGVISEIIQKRPYAIEKSCVVVIGYGHCGQVIAKKLRALEANVHVIEKDEQVRKKAIEDGFDVISAEELVMAEIIINTAPKDAIDSCLLEKLNKGTYLFDISSFPYGYYHEEAAHAHDYILPALPSVYGYKESGKIWADFIMKRGGAC